MPDAPPPTFDSAGNLVSAWQIVVVYDPGQDSVTVSRHQEAGPYHPERRSHDTWDPEDVEGMVMMLAGLVRSLSARRLF